MRRWLFALTSLSVVPAVALAQAPTWGAYNGNAQHTGVSSVALQAQNVVKWSTPVDLQPQYVNGNELLIHYGSPLATAANTIVVPVKTGANNGFQVEGRFGYDGSLKWTQTTDYTLPPHDWTPSYAPVITPQNRLYYAGNGGTIYYRDNIDTAGNVTPTQLAFYGIGNYQTNQTSKDAANNNVFINTPISSDSSGNIFFGFQVTGTMAVNIGGTSLQPGGGLARISAAGVGSYVQASTAASDSAINKLVHNAAPAISNDGSKVYVAVTTNQGTGFGSGYLLALNSADLSTTGKVSLNDVNTPANKAYLPESGSAAPMVGPDGDVYMGVLEHTNQYHSRGWMLHFDSTLTQTKIASRFGWDNTASIISPSMVPSYTGNSPYLILTKYNNYVSTGGDGKNKLGIFDPFVSETDQDFYNIAKGNPIDLQVAKKILEVTGVTPDPEFPGVPGAVREWCINSAAVDPITKTVLVNSEDGKSYVWDLTTNTLTSVVTLTTGIGEAYTPTIIGPDGTGYAINNGTLFAIAAVTVPEPSTLFLSGIGAVGFGFVVWRKHRRSRA